MIRSYKRRYWFLAAALSALAGYADANAFVHLGGYFVSFMSGNSTRLGVGLAHQLGSAAIAGGLIALFVLGVIFGALLNPSGTKPGSTRVLVSVTALLTLASALASIGAAQWAIPLLACAMGAMNAVFQRDGEVSIGLTYMTGTLVRLGQRIANALKGGERWDWAPYLLLWMGLVLGAAFGAFAYGQVGLSALWVIAGAGGLLTAIFARLPEAGFSSR
jgi:uncharacterized membrane protein YoaK (UPF0700 family)